MTTANKGLGSQKTSKESAAAAQIQFIYSLYNR